MGIIKYDNLSVCHWNLLRMLENIRHIKACRILHEYKLNDKCSLDYARNEIKLCELQLKQISEPEIPHYIQPVWQNFKINPTQT